MIEAGLKQRRSDMIKCAIYCIVISIYYICMCEQRAKCNRFWYSCTFNELS